MSDWHPETSWDLSKLCQPKCDPLKNDLGQNPCQIAQILIQACSPPRQYRLPPLSEMQMPGYDAPDRMESSPCVCSMSTYNLVQACAACQISEPTSAMPWKEFIGYCTNFDTNYGASFPLAVPMATEIPAWAENWNPTFNLSNVFTRLNSQKFYPSSQQISQTASSAYSAASSSATSSTPSLFPTLLPDTKSAHSHKKRIMFTAAVASGIVAAFLLGVLVGIFWYWRKKQRRRQQGTRLRSLSDVTSPEMIQRQQNAQLGGNGSRYTFDTNSVSTGTNFHANQTQRNSSNSSLGLSLNTADAQSVLTRESNEVDPFSDRVFPAARLGARNSIYTRSESGSEWPSSSMTSSRSPASEIRLSDTEDEISLRTTSSRPAPSWSGATYGGAEQDLISLGGRSTD